MKCRICGCEMPDSAEKCEICGVFAEIPTPVVEEELQEERNPMNKGAKIALTLGISLLIALIIGGLAWLCADTMYPVSEGVWLDRHFEMADIGIEMDLTDEYERDAAAEKKNTTESMICDAIVQTPRKETMMYLYRMDLTAESPFGVFVGESSYLELLQESFETSSTFAAYKMLPHGEIETVSVGGLDFLCASYEGSFTDENGVVYPLCERILIRREGRTIIFIDIASSSAHEDIDTLLALIKPCEE